MVLHRYSRQTAIAKSLAHTLVPNIPATFDAVRFKTDGDLRRNVSKLCTKFTIFGHQQPGAFLAAAVWGGQWGGHICIWGAKNSG